MSAFPGPRRAWFRGAALVLLLAALSSWHAAGQERGPCRLADAAVTACDGRIRISLGFDRLPRAQRYALRDGTIVVDLPETALSGDIAMPSIPSGAEFLRSLTARQVNFRRVQLELRCLYGLPGEQVSLCEEGSRLLIELRPAFLEETSCRVTPGLAWRRIREGTGSRFLLINLLEARLADDAVSLDVGLPASRPREATSVMARDAGALAAVNGGFFHGRGGALGLVVRNGALVARDVSWRPPRTALGVTEKGRLLINRVRWGSRGLETVLPEDDRPAPFDAWKSVKTALGGGPRLLLDGRLHVTAAEEALGPGGNDITREAARTVAGATRDGRLVLAVISGRRDNHSEGMRLEEAAAFLARRGVVDAMAFDGGTSSTMILAGRHVSAPPAARPAECPVGDALLLLDKGKPLVPYMVNLKFSIDSLPADGVSTAVLEGRIVDALGKRVPPWTTATLETEPAGLLPSSVKVRRGKFRVPFTSARLPGEVRATVTCGLGMGTATIRLNAGAPAHLFARAIGLDGQGPGGLPEGIGAEALVTDAFFNPLAGQAVTATTEGETTVDSPRAATDASGTARFRITARAGGGAVILTACGLAPVKVPLQREVPRPTPLP